MAPTGAGGPSTVASPLRDGDPGAADRAPKGHDQGGCRELGAEPPEGRGPGFHPVGGREEAVPVRAPLNMQADARAANSMVWCFVAARGRFSGPGGAWGD
eukprot:134454-Alexandrium_andersonii.AAC.1